MSKIIRTDVEGNPILQGSDAWKALRVGMVTGTTIASLMGTKGAYDTAVRVMTAERLTGQRKAVKATGAMRQGVEREPFARMWYESQTGRIVEEVAFIKHDWMNVGISPDGILESERRTVEFKCPEADSHMEYLQYKDYPVKGEYYGQIQAGLWLTGFEVCDFCTFNDDFTHEGLQGHIVSVPRNDEYISRLEEKVTLFLSEVNVKVQDFKNLGASRTPVTTHSET